MSRVVDVSINTVSGLLVDASNACADLSATLLSMENVVALIDDRAEAPKARGPTRALFG
jgi:hypothetical protein